MSIAKVMRESSFFHFVNRPIGRVLRIAGGIQFLILGYLAQGTAPGMALMGLGLAMAATSAVDLCLASAALGGPIRGKRILASRP